MSSSLNELKKELRCSNISEVKVAARECGYDIVDPEKRLNAKTIGEIRAAIQARRLAGEDSEDPADESAEAVPTPNSRDAARRVPGTVKGEGFSVYLHDDVATWMIDVEARLRDRANLLLRQFLAHGGSTRIKGVKGAGRGWLRSGLGGNGGYQWYLWWTRRGGAGADDLGIEEREIFVRAVRHHNDTHMALPSGARADYALLDPTELATDFELYGHAFSGPQLAVAAASSAVRLVQGHPGSGKTTALWSAICQAEGDRVLYVTFSDHLGQQADRYIRALGPRAQSVTVKTVVELLDDLAPGGTPDGRINFDPQLAAIAFQELVAKDFRGGLGPWEGRLAELYCELHAHWAGSALPVTFRGGSATDGPTMSRVELLARRESIVGKVAAEAASRVGDFLSANGRAAVLFPGPFRAHAVLDRLAAGSSLPTAYQDLDWIVVDEVQDLTLVEAEVIVQLAKAVEVRGDADRCLPGLIAAGDEGQTVRPTDFDWGAFADLVSRIGPPERFELPSNVRCPPNLAALINQSWDFYGDLLKTERPRGLARVPSESHEDGRVIVVEAASHADLQRLFEFVDETPGAAIVYPGLTIPEPYARLAREMLARREAGRPSQLTHGGESSSSLWTSRSAKGLDFQVVVLLDAGRGISEADALARAARKGTDLAAVWSRNLVDQFRVGISRATDTLLLVDVAPDHATRRALERLCHGVVDIQHADTAEAEVLLTEEGLDVADAIGRFIDEIRRLTYDHPLRALQKTRNAERLLQRSAGATTDSDKLRSALAGAGAVAAVVAALKQDEGGQHTSAEAQMHEAQELFRRAHDIEAAKGAEFARHIVKTQTAKHHQCAAAVRDLATIIPKLPKRLHDVQRLFVQLVRRWCRSIALTAPIADRPKVRAALAKDLSQLASAVTGALSDLGQEIAELVREYRLRTGDWLRDRREYGEALDWYEGLDVPARVGFCLEEQGQMKDAATFYEAAGEMQAAIRCTRRVPDWPRTLELVRQHGSPEMARSINWANRVVQLLEETRDQQAAADFEALTESERRDLLERFQSHRLIAVGGSVKRRT
jgi:hypothetical protein